MAADLKRVLVLGGTGYLGEAVLRGLAARGVPAAFTFHGDEGRARALGAALGQQALPVDLRDPAAIRAAAVALSRPEAAPAPSVLIHCAAVARAAPLAEIDDDAWDETLAVNARSAFIACRELAPHLADIVFCAALDGVQSVPSPADFGASQGALLGLTRALAKELGPRGVRVNLCVIGLLDGGIGGTLAPALRADFKKFSALGRVGTADVAARAVLWLALDNTYMTGAVLPVTGGL